METKGKVKKVNDNEYKKLKKCNEKYKAIIIILVFAIILMILLFVLSCLDKNVDNSKKDNEVVENNVDGGNTSVETINTDYIYNFNAVTLTTDNQSIQMGDSAFNVRIEKESEESDYGVLFIDDNLVTSNGINVNADTVYVADTFMFFTSFGQIGNVIVYALDNNGNYLEVINDYNYQINSFYLDNGVIYAAGSKCCLADGDIDDGTYGQRELVIKYENNVITIE